MNFPQNIIVHHSLVSREKNSAQFAAIDRYHRNKGWGMIGYHYLIEPNGEIVHGREENQVGAHCKENMMNYRSIGICLSGNFDIEDPTIEQVKALNKLIKDIMNRRGIPAKNIYPHRNFATYKSCWGSRLPNDILGYLEMRLEEQEKAKLSSWAEESAKKAKELGFWSDQSNPQEPALTLKGTYYLKNLGLITKIEKDEHGKDKPATIEQLNHAFFKNDLLRKY